MNKFPDPKIGDPVCIVLRGGWARRIYNVIEGTIEQTTATRITALDGRQFMRSTGREVGYRTDELLPLTDEIKQEFQQHRMEEKAELQCRIAAEVFNRARGQDAIDMAALLPETLKGEAQ